MTNSLAKEGVLIDPSAQILPNSWLSHIAKLLCFAVLFLIFFGSLVTSHQAGLAVPDWPTSFGENMFLFPPDKWQGNIFYEHVHRLIASAIGAITLLLTVGILLREPRRWVKILAVASLLAVIIQGVLGGLTVLYLLPDAISVAHAMLAQTFFILTIVLAYSLSTEFSQREFSGSNPEHSFYRSCLLFTGLVYIQILFGAIMRHAEAGLAIPDFPEMAGSWSLIFDAARLEAINGLRANLSLSEVNFNQVMFHLVHRVFGFVLLGYFILFHFRGLQLPASNPKRTSTLKLIASLIGVQIALGILTITSQKAPYIASLHVVTGALMLGSCVLLTLRSYVTKR